MVAVLSSSIAAVGYDDEAWVLLVRFREGGHTYRYEGVPRSVFDGMLQASSKGRYFTDAIRDQYTHTRVD